MISSDFKRKDRCYCDEFWLIENYDKAIADTSQTWICHHKKEISDKLTHKELKEMNLLYHRQPEELIFVTAKEHAAIHDFKSNLKRDIAGNKNPMFGKKHSNATKKLMSKRHKVAVKNLKRDYHGRFIKEEVCK